MPASLLLAVLLPLAAHAAPKVETFSPQGTVKNPRQVRVHFEEPMVSFGDPRSLESPFEVSCPSSGTARWATEHDWVYDFVQDLGGGVRCSFTLKKGGKRFEFSTGGPSVVEQLPNNWEPISEDQLFVLGLDTAADAGSVLKNVYFSVDGLGERVEARLVEGADRETLLKGLRWTRDPAATVVLGAKRRFPPDAKLRLVWGKGVAALGGVATETDQELGYRVRPDFTANMSCERAARDEGCVPFLPISVGFSAPTAWVQARKAFIADEKGRKWPPKKVKNADEEGAAPDSPLTTRGLTFEGPFPAESRLRLELPAGLTDESGRALANASKFPLEIRLGEYPPLAKFPSSFGILEARAGAVLPVTLRALEPQVKAKLMEVSGGAGAVSALDRLRGKIARAEQPKPYDVMAALARVAHAQREAPAVPDGKPFEVAKPRGANAFEVVGIPLKRPGLYLVELESLRLGTSLLGTPRPMYVPTAALVTNLSVHLKLGRESSLVWVTRLDDGRAAAGADVTVTDCKGAVLFTGKTGPDGTARTGRLPARDSLPWCKYPASRWDERWRLFAQARLGDDMSFALDSWDEGIEPWRFQLRFDERGTPSAPRRTVLDRSLLRAGETVRMKHFVRELTMAGFSVPPRERWPSRAIVRHRGSDARYELPLSWSADGSAESRWDIPKEAKLGTYDVLLPDPGRGDEEYWYPEEEETAASFRVEEFRVPLMSASIQPPTHPLVAVSTVPLLLQARYLSGGAASGLAAKLRTQAQQAAAPSFADYEGFVFSNGPAPRGDAREARPAPAISSVDVTLDAGGAARVTAPGEPGAATPLELHSELEFRDPNGETQTVSARVPLWPSSLLLGLKLDSWTMSADALKAEAAVVDLKGRPAPGVQVAVELLERKYASSRKRLVGGFYAYEHSVKARSHGVVCSGRTDARGVLSCAIKPPVSGAVVLEASAADQSGRPLRAHHEAYVAGKDEWWFEVGDSDRMDVVPERKRWEPGQTAALQVRMPFRQATALVTIEREGVIDAWVRPLTGKAPVIRVPIKGSYAPNVFVSVLAVRGRAATPQPTALVDLGRPSYRLGTAELEVGRGAHELKVSVTPDQPVYKVRQTASVALEVKGPGGRPLPPGAEAAVAVVDEGLLELMPNKSWDLLDAMMGRRALSVRTATAQTHVVGKRHFGLKALPQGGGGGKATTRELFDTLLYWNARVPLDAQGRARVEVPLNDSVTGFRVAAIAAASSGLFGTGQASFRSTQDLMVLSGLPPVARRGDRFDAVFTVRNATAKPAQVEVTARIEGQPALETRRLSLPAQGAAEVSWSVEAPASATALDWRVEASADNGARDSLKVSQRLEDVYPVRTLQATLAQVDGTLTLPVERPKDAEPGRGGLDVALSPSIAGGVDGIVEYMTRYPYSCLEQRTSKAVALKDEAMWKSIAAALPNYVDGDGLLKYFPSMNEGSDALTSYVVSVVDEAGWRLPAEAREKILGGLERFAEGRITRGRDLAGPELTARKLAALEALSRHGRAKGAALTAIKPDPKLWPTSAVVDWISLQRRLGGETADAESVLRSRLDFQGTVMSFSTDREDALWWLMVSSDLNAVKLLLAELESKSWQGDLPRLLRGALERRKRGHWDLTTANAWGRLAVDKFAARFESEPVGGATTVSAGAASGKLEWTAPPSTGAVTLPWPDGKATLTVAHAGAGKPWATISSRAALPLKEPFSSGYRVVKTVSPLQQKTPGRWSRGDLARVRLEIDAQADRTWVVVDDPVPAGASVLGSGLGRDSSLSTQGERAEGWAWPAFQERAFTSFRSYYEEVPKGRFTLEYTMRLNNAGEFRLPATHVESMYAPESLGELPNAPVEVAP